MKHQVENSSQDKVPTAELGCCDDSPKGNTLEGLQDARERLSYLIFKSTTLWSRSQASPSRAIRLGNHKIRIDEAEDIRVQGSARKVIDALSELGASKPSMISTRSGLSLPTVQRLLKKLLIAGHVSKSGKTKGVRYTLPKHKNNE